MGGTLAGPFASRLDGRYDGEPRSRWSKMGRRQDGRVEGWQGEGMTGWQRKA